MGLDTKVEEIMLKAINVNLGYKDGEKVIIVDQRWEPSLGEKSRGIITDSIELCEHLIRVYGSNGVPVAFFTYVPSALGSGVNPTQELYDQFRDYENKNGIPQIVIAPCGYSITHTAWRKAQCEKGSRIVTMSNSSLAMFSQNGPFDAQGHYSKVVEETMSIAKKLRASEYVRITGSNTDLVVNVNPNLVITSTGRTIEEGDYGNWLGAETFVVPIHLGNSYGHFFVPKGWGGREQLEHSAIFHIKEGRFVDISTLDGSIESQAWLDKKIKPTIFGKPNYDVVAELGFGTNPAVSEEYLMKHWSIAIGEKKGQTVHVAHGNSKAMGGENDVDIHQDFVILNVDKVEFDYRLT